LNRIVLKVGGNELDNPAFVDGLVGALLHLRQTYAVTLVHGGGKAISRLQEQLHLQAHYVEGLRVTDDVSLDVAEMVLSGLVNKRLVGRLVADGLPAVGMSGVDGGLLRVVKMKHEMHDLGWVGDIVETHLDALEPLLEAGVTPIVSPISLGLDGHTYNVNADHAAAALACALGADELAFVSDVPGVLGDSEGECIPLLDAADVAALIDAGTIHSGMVPKVQSALAALDEGVPRVRITNLDGLCIDGGTCFVVLK
jgi:acetylglutamate kinase